MEECYFTQKFEEKSQVLSTTCGTLSPSYEFEGKKYCVLHLPVKDKTTEFTKAFNKKVDDDDYDFRGVYFPPDFSIVNRTFSERVIFIDAIFSGANFFDKIAFEKQVDFLNTKFLSTVWFDNVNFEGVTFYKSEFFGDVHINGCEFKKSAGFQNIVLHNVANMYIRKSSFKGFIGFGYAVIKGQIYFEGDIDHRVFSEQESCILRFGYLTSSYSKNLHFYDVFLRPSWFIDVDATQIDFINVYWDGLQDSSSKSCVIQELQHMNFMSGRNLKGLLKVACRQLSQNSRDHSRFEESSKFRRMAFEVEYLEWKEKARKWWSEEIFCRDFFTKFVEKLKDAPWDLAHRAYRFTSYYGESWSQALFCFVFICPIFALLFYSPKYVGQNLAL